MPTGSTKDIRRRPKALLGAALAALVLAAAPGEANAWETGPLGPSDVRFNSSQDVMGSKIRLTDGAFNKLEAYIKR
jgi:hypothetical protein